jgi:hypothetical protein
MAIKVKCACGASYHVADETAGRKVRCQHCQAVLSVPGGEEAPSASGAKARPDKGDSGTAPAVAERSSGKRRRKRGKRSEKKNREDRILDPWETDRETLEQRLARWDDTGSRGREIRRGLYYLATGVAFFVLGGMLTWLMAELAKNRGLEQGFGILTLAYKVGGIWTFMVLCTIAGLIPLAIGLLNLVGVGVVVEDADD